MNSTIVIICVVMSLSTTNDSHPTYIEMGEVSDILDIEIEGMRDGCEAVGGRYIEFKRGVK